MGAEGHANQLAEWWRERERLPDGGHEKGCSSDGPGGAASDGGDASVGPAGLAVQGHDGWGEHEASAGRGRLPRFGYLRLGLLQAVLRCRKCVRSNPRQHVLPDCL